MKIIFDQLTNFIVSFFLKKNKQIILIKISKFFLLLYNINYEI